MMRRPPRSALFPCTTLIRSRSGSYERVLRDGRDTALQEMIDEAQRLGAQAIVGVHMDYGAIGKNEGMMMVTVSGTADRKSTRLNSSHANISYAVFFLIKNIH